MYVLSAAFLVHENCLLCREKVIGELAWF